MPGGHCTIPPVSTSHVPGYPTCLFETTKETSSDPLRAYLVGVRRREDTPTSAQEHLEELTQLVATMGTPVLGEEIAAVQSPTPQYLLGTGKAEEIKARAEMAQANLIIIDDDLTPAQQRNWEKLTGLAVIDRREVILDIFQQRAQTREARLQVQLARLEYSLPRLKRAWTHLERQRGGGGFTGGAGEAQIEVDRRMVREDILKLKRELKEVRRSRATMRARRQGKPVPTAAIIGYTNAGKSTLLNYMTKAGVLAEDKLFATLDPTTRRVNLPNNQELLLTDTVGFIRKLPHMLVDAFMATLEESQLADMLLHVVDASHPQALDHLRATHKVLEEINVLNRPTLYVLNKIDRPIDPIVLAELRAHATPNVMVSGLTGQGIDELVEHLADFTREGLVPFTLVVPHSRHDLVGFLHREGHVRHEAYEEDGVHMEVELAAKHRHRVEDFLE
ncbi:GTPase HflX [bacterium]|nr:GTPase HflX [bacterium]